MKRNRLLLLLALLMTAATGAWAQTSDKETPLTLQATADGWISISHPKANMKYKVGDDGQMQTVTGTDKVTIDVIAGQTVQFFGNGTSITAYGEGSNYTHFGSSVKCYIYGNIMSLVNEDDFATATELTADYAFKLLFSYFDNLSNHASRKLVLPAMTLTKECYYGMFLGCKDLTEAPALPAQNLAEDCYESMFDGCSSLTAAPELPATELKEDCYYSMFSNCTSLTTAPLLPAPTLAEGCYCWMFDGCTNLNAVTCLATNISAKYATLHWLEGVAATGTLTIAKGTEDKWTANSADGIPSGWTTDVYGYKVKLADGTADAGNWTATVGTSTTPQSLPVAGLSKGDAVTLTYGGRLKVKSVTATIDAEPAANSVDLSTLTADYKAQNGDVLTGETTSYKVTIAAGATVTLDGVNISSSDYCIKCLGNATIILKDGSTNTLTSTSQEYPALSIGDANTTLTIQGSTGVLNVTSGLFCAGIGGGFRNANYTCGNIRIEGGVITAQGGESGSGIGTDCGPATCGDIIITGGTITANAGGEAAGIGTGNGETDQAVCGGITIANTVTKVTATKGGEFAPYSIGKGYGGYCTCGTVTIGCTLDTNGNPVGGTKYWENNAVVDSAADDYLRQATIIYPEP